MDPAIETILRGALAVLFLSAAGHKLRGFGEFSGVLARYELVPQRATRVAARLAVAAELGVAAALLVPRLRSAALVVAAGLLALYSAAIAINLGRGRRHIDCGCTGPATRQSLSEWLVARNALLVGMALACLAPVGTRPLVWVDAVTIPGGIAVLAATYASLNHLTARAPSLARERG